MQDRNIDSRHLIAPELAVALEYLPDLDFSQGIEAFRGGLAARERPPLPPELVEVTCTERFVPGTEGAPDVRVLHYVPPGEPRGARPAVVHMHGGGYVLGSADINDASNRAMALALDCVVLSVDYRLAPETIWPGALQDCYAALSWLAANADELDIDLARVAVAGESAGGGHAAALALYARDRGGPAIRFALLEAPMLDDRTGSATDPHPYCGEFVWTPEKNRYGWSALLGVEAGSAEVPESAVPARACDLAGFPPTFISVGALDLFMEENMEFTRRLTRAGVPVELHVVPGAYHGYGVAQTSPQVEQTESLRLAALARAFAGL